MNAKAPTPIPIPENLRQLAVILADAARRRRAAGGSRKEAAE